METSWNGEAAILRSNDVILPKSLRHVSQIHFDRLRTIKPPLFTPPPPPPTRGYHCRRRAPQLMPSQPGVTRRAHTLPPHTAHRPCHRRTRRRHRPWTPSLPCHRATTIPAMSAPMTTMTAVAVEEYKKS
jgi:hypothetical protein